MMNLSKQSIDDGVSMYLSFESTLSESTYKTLAGDEASDVFDLLENSDSNGNTTLEPQIDDTAPTMKDTTQTDTSSTQGTLVPLRYPLTQILREYNALSSTPSKTESSEFTSETECVTANEYLEKKNLSGLFDKLVAKYEQVNNKENELPNLSEESLPSFSKTSIIALQKQNQNLVVGTESEVLNRLLDVHPKEGENKCENQAIENIKVETTISKFTTENEEVKIKQTARKSVCEPNLLTNRPSRIVPKKKTRFSLASIKERSNVLLTQQSTIRVPPPKAPIVLSYPSANTDSDEKVNIAHDSKYNEESKCNTNTRAAAGGSRKSLAAPRVITNAARRSVVPSSQQDKRLIAVKTTLNSSTRKKTYRMSMANGTVTKRRSVLLLQSKIASPLGRSKLSGSSQETETVTDQGFKPRTAGGDDATKKIQTKRSENMRKTMFIEKPHDIKFACIECGQSYNVKSLLDAHKKTHLTDVPEITKRSPYTMSTAVSTPANNPITPFNTQNHKCKYCDKIFVLERALHIHLMEHCLKIPATERRKLDFTENNHVEKAETPHFRAPKKLNTPKPLENNKEPITQRMSFRKAGGTAIPSDELKMTNKKSEFISTKKTTDNTVKKLAQKNSPRDDSDETQMPPPSAKMKKKSAHAGVYRTPNKNIPCRSCKQSFKNILDFTNHMMSTHSSLSDSNNSIDG